MHDGQDKGSWTRRGLLVAAAAAGAASVADASGDGDSGTLWGGKMALSKAYNVSGDLWIGPDSAKSKVSAESGRVYLATDLQHQYYGDAGSWVQLGIGTQNNPVPEVYTTNFVSEDFNLTSSTCNIGATFPGWGDANSTAVPTTGIGRIVMTSFRISADTDSLARVSCEVTDSTGTFQVAQEIEIPAASLTADVTRSMTFGVPSGRSYRFVRTNNAGVTETNSTYSYIEFGE